MAYPGMYHNSIVFDNSIPSEKKLILFEELVSSVPVALHNLVCQDVVLATDNVLI